MSKWLPSDEPITATCVSCGRVYETCEAMVQAVKDGKAESLCGYCDKSHDDK
jgi:hypothetical protein